MNGGHNPVEPAHNNCVVITGPHIYNWENVFLNMINDKACFLCKNLIELDQIMNNLFQDSNMVNLLKIRAKDFAKKSFFEIDKLISKIDNSFNKAKC